MLEIRTFGGFSIRENGWSIKDLGANKAKALMIYLTVERSLHTRSELATLFWAECTEQHAATSLRVALSILRKSLGGYLDISRSTVELKPGADVYLDVSDLESKLAEGDIEAALRLYQGDFLEGFHVRECPEFEDWLRLEQERLRELITEALDRAISRAIDAKDYSKGRMLVNRMLEHEPFEERAYYHSIMLHGLVGERSAALAQYEKCREILQKELEAEPSEELQELHERIQRGDKPAKLISILPENNLPIPQTSFIGREKELAKINTLVRDPACRLLTLVGTGGSGKTRLAIQAAGEVLRWFPDGTFFVPLEATESAAYLIPAIAQALRFTLDSFINGADLRTQILDYLRKQSILLVLDGCENMAGRLGDLEAILAHAPNVRVLATSRQRLGLSSERAFPVEGLSVPRFVEEMRSDGMEAVRLFRERAEQAGSGFQLSPADYEPVFRICKMVDGIPLGIELAAAWTSILTPLEIANAAGKSLDFLTASMSDIPKRHRSLRAVFESSWSLLSDDLRKAFSKLAIFCGGFDLPAAQQVSGVSLDQLLALFNRSLLYRTQTGRFTIHNLLRQYAAEKLSAQEALEKEIQNRYSQYYLNLVTQREKELMGSGMLRARDEIRREMDNIQAAIRWASAHWPEEAARKMLIALVAFYAVHGWQEGMLAFEDIARIRKESLLVTGHLNPSEDPVFLSARIHQAFFQCNLGLIVESDAISQECLEWLRQPGLESELSVCLQNLGVNASLRGEYKRSQELLEEAILLGRECDHIMWPTYLLWLGNLYFQLGEYEQGLLSLQKSHELFERKGTLWGTAFALSKIAMAEDGLGEHARAKNHHKQALTVFERLESKAGKAYALSRMSMSAYFLEQYPEAALLAHQGYDAFNEIGHRWGICTSLCALGFANIGLGDLERAKAYFRDALKESRPDQIVPQSLYALIGIACCMAQEGEEGRATELIQFVQKHPETPTIYLEQAVRWISYREDSSLLYPEQNAGVNEALETIDAVVRRILE